MIGAEQSTEAFAPYHTTRLTTHCSRRRDKPVVEALVIAFGMIVGQVLVDRMMQGAFPQHDHPFQGLFPGFSDLGVRLVFMQHSRPPYVKAL